MNYKLITEEQRIALAFNRENSLDIHDYFNLLKQIPEINASTAEIWFSVADSVYQSHILSHRFVFHEAGRKNLMFLLAGYPSAYLEQLPQMLWPNWYTACFVREYHNSSMWANYADGHRGACLIFEATTDDGVTKLELEQITGWGFSRDSGEREHWGFAPVSFYQIDYKPKPDEVDFFTSMGQLTRGTLTDFWYTSEQGELSSCADRLIAPTADMDALRKHYWDGFFRHASFKTRDWEYEKEFRLILSAVWWQSLDKRQRTLSYDFKSLKGIIFGMRMSDDDKWEIFNTLGQKCRQLQRTDFQFLQAYYSPETGDIRSYEIPVNLTGDINQTNDSAQEG